MTTTTRSQAQKTSMEHVLEVVFNLKPDSPLHCAMKHNGYVVPEDFLMEKDEDLNDLKYPDDTGALIVINKGDAGLLKCFKGHVAELVRQGIAFPDDDSWKTLTWQPFNTF